MGRSEIGFPCCKHCVDDPIFHEDNEPDTHEIGCDICDRDKIIGDAFRMVANEWIHPGGGYYYRAPIGLRDLTPAAIWEWLDSRARMYDG